MAFIFPDSTIELYRGVEITVGQQIAFANASQQNAYFQAHKVAQSVNCTYVRKTGTLKVEYPPQTVAQCNYIGFRNAAFENKVFFARILNYEYVNNVTTEILYAIDYFQSFCFDVNYEEGLIEREHLSADGFDLSVVNPYSNDPLLYEMTTSENLSVGKTMENPEETTVVTGDRIANMTGKDSMVFTDRIVCVAIAEFDTSEIPSYNDFLKCFGLVIPPSGGVIWTSNTYADKIYEMLGLSKRAITFNPRFAHGFSIYCSYSDDKKNLTNALNWLTLNGLTQQILGIWSIGGADLGAYLQANELNDFGTYSDTSQSITVKPPFVSQAEDGEFEYVNRKLYRYPYQYLRVGTPAGNVKEYQWEKFINIINDRHQSEGANFSRLFMFDDIPRVSLIPKNYGRSLQDAYDESNYNLDEKMVNGDFSQLPYNIDSYLTYMSNVYQSMIGSTTEEKEFFQSSGYGLAKSSILAPLDLVGNVIGSAISVAGNATATDLANGALSDSVNLADRASKMNSIQQSNAQNVAGAFQAGSGAISGMFESGRLQNEQRHLYHEMGKLRNTRPETASAIGNGDSVVDVVGPAKPAYVADIYTPPVISSIESYYAGNGYGSTSYSFTYVKLIRAIAQAYDHYFSLYGYASYRVGTPRICNYIKGLTDGSQIPHWDDTTSRTITYIKTSGMKVISPMKVVSDYIEQLFDAGVRFIKGDTL